MARVKREHAALGIAHDRHATRTGRERPGETFGYRNLVIAYRNNAAVRLSDVAEVTDSVEDLRNQGLSNGKPSVLVILNRAPGANIIDTVDRVKALLPTLKASIPANIDLTVANDRTTTIRASLADVEHTLLVAIALVFPPTRALLKQFVRGRLRTRVVQRDREATMDTGPERIIDVRVVERRVSSRARARAARLD